MAEALPAEDDWSTEVETESPEGGSPHPLGWEDDDQRRIREAEANLINQANVTDEIQGGSQVTQVSTEQLAVAQIQEETASTNEEITPAQALAKKKVADRLVQGRKLKDQLQVAQQEARESSARLTEVMTKLVAAQREVTSHSASLGRKKMEILNLEATSLKLRQDMRVMEIDQLRWSSVQNDTQTEQIALEVAHMAKMSIAMDIMGRLSCHLSEDTAYPCRDIRQTVELHMEGELAMTQARAAIQEPSIGEGIEEARLNAVRALLKEEQEVMAKQTADKKAARAVEIAANAAEAAKVKVAKETKARQARLALDRRNQAEDARKAEAEARATRARDEWEMVPKPKKKVAEANTWAEAVDRQMVREDIVPGKSEDYKSFRKARVGEIAATRSVVACAVIYTRLANCGLGVLTTYASSLTANIRDSIRRDVASACIDGLRRFMEGGAYQNVADLLKICEQVHWFNDQERCVHDLYRIKLELFKGNKRGMELKAKDWLTLCQERGWKWEKVLASKVLATYNSC